MSMLGSIYRAITTLLFGQRCMVCDEPIDHTMHGICIKCRYSIPLTLYSKSDDNPVKALFDGLAPIEHGSAHFFYSGSDLWRNLVHRFKYGGMWHIAYSMGRWYGAELKESGLYDDVDVIVPIPLHPLKILKRGYNQSTYIAEGIARELDKEVDNRSVKRIRNNPSQARKLAVERWANVEELFSVRHPERLKGRHILLVDDVLTTGATISSCIEAILAVVPDCRISVAVLAVSKRRVSKI